MGFVPVEPAAAWLTSSSPEVVRVEAFPPVLASVTPNVIPVPALKLVPVALLNIATSIVFGEVVVIDGATIAVAEDAAALATALIGLVVLTPLYEAIAPDALLLTEKLNAYGPASPLPATL
jgi:hypothetical protein